MDFYFSDDVISSFVSHGWQVQLRNGQVDAEDHISKAINLIDKMPLAYKNFLNKYKLLVGPGEKSWFLMLEDYMEVSDSSFAWNEFEIQSMDAALDDSDRSQVQSFWSNHLPIFISLKNGYSYLAARINDHDKWSVVYGYEPEYENAETLFPSLDIFFESLADHVSGKSINSILNILI